LSSHQPRALRACGGSTYPAFGRDQSCGKFEKVRWGMRSFFFLSNVDVFCGTYLE
jgi:hypothetical protein